MNDNDLLIAAGLGVAAFFLIKKPISALTPGQQALTATLPQSPRTGTSAYNAWVQESLNYLQGSGLAVDGIIGPATRAAIMQFQTTWQITADGIIGPETDYYIRSALGMQGYTDAPYNPRPLF